MRRLRSLVLIGALALAVGAVAAGPAAAAKGGNNDTAKRCQKGGWKSLTAQTGAPFANQGDCVNDGAHGLGAVPPPRGCDRVRQPHRQLVHERRQRRIAVDVHIPGAPEPRDAVGADGRVRQRWREHGRVAFEARAGGDWVALLHDRPIDGRWLAE